MARYHPERFTEDPDRYGDVPFGEAPTAKDDSRWVDAPEGSVEEPGDADERDPELRDLTDDELFVRLTAYLGETEPLHGLATSVATVAAAESAASGYRTLEYAERAARDAELERVREWLERRGVGRPVRAGTGRNRPDETDPAAGQVDTAQAAR